jgi:hypothetical protein
VSAARQPQGANSAPRGAAQRPHSPPGSQAAGDHADTRAVPPRLLWWLAAGFGVWCSALVFLYALHAIGCVFAWRPGTLRLTLALVFLAHVLVAAWIWRNAAKSVPDTAFGRTGNFLHTAVVWTAIAAVVATIVTFGPPLLLATCI